MDDDATRLMYTLIEESDRGLVLAGAAFLDDALADLLRVTFRDDLSKRDDDSLFTHFGPCSSMSSRTLVTYALELIDFDMRKAIDQLRKIRNHFAHFAGLTSLPTDEIETLFGFCDPSLELAVTAFGKTDDPKYSDERVRVTLCIVSIWAKLKHKTNDLTSPSQS